MFSSVLSILSYACYLIQLPRIRDIFKRPILGEIEAVILEVFIVLEDVMSHCERQSRGHLGHFRPVFYKILKLPGPYRVV
jgi:hypothetical protein